MQEEKTAEDGNRTLSPYEGGVEGMVVIQRPRYHSHLISGARRRRNVAVSRQVEEGCGRLGPYPGKWRSAGGTGGSEGS